MSTSLNISVTLKRSEVSQMLWIKALWEKQCNDNNINMTGSISIEINSRRTKLMLFSVSAFAEQYLMVTFFHAIRTAPIPPWELFFSPSLMPIMARSCRTGHSQRSKSCTMSILPYVIIPTLWHGAVPVVPEVPQRVIFSYTMCTLLSILCARNVLNKKHFSSSISCPRRKVDIISISIKTDWTANQYARPEHLNAIRRVPLPPHSQPRFCNAPLPHFSPIPC